MRKWPPAIIAIIIFAKSIAGVSSEVDSFSRTELEKLITQNQISTIAELVPKLPRDFAAFRLEMYDSKSLHCATPKAPRVLLLSKNGHLACSYNSGVAADYAHLPKNCLETLNMLECMQFDVGQARDRTFQIEFNPDDRKKMPFDLARKTTENPTSCQTCHTKAIRRIWGPYHIWPCAYGSNDDVRIGQVPGTHDYPGEQNSKEKELELTYLKNKNLETGNSRYSLLPPVDTSSESYAKKPNVRANQVFQEMQIAKIAREIATDPKLHPARYAILGTLLCGSRKITKNPNLRSELHSQWQESFFPAELELDYNKSIERAHRNLIDFSKTVLADRKACLGSDLQPQERRPHLSSAGVSLSKPVILKKNSDAALLVTYPDTNFQDQQLKTGADLIHLEKTLGLDFSHWSMDFNFAMVFDSGGGHFAHELATEIARELHRHGDRELEKLFPSIKDRKSSQLVCFGDTQPELARLSRRALEGPRAKSVAPGARK